MDNLTVEDKAKQNAKELVGKFGNNLAIICVDEIIKELGMLRKPEYTTFIAWEQLKVKEEADTWDGFERIEYWLSVKTAIENL